MNDTISGAQNVLPEFRVAAVLSDTFKAFFTNFFKILGVGLILFLTFGAAVFLTGYFMQPEMGQAFEAASVPNPLWTFAPMPIMFSFVVLAQTAIIHASTETLAGRSSTFRDMTTTAARRFLPVLGASTLIAFLYFLGAMMFLIPGLIVLIALSVTVPAILVEGIGVFKALERSSSLTKGHWWAIFGTMATLFVIIWIAVLILVVIASILSTWAGSTGEIIVSFVPFILLTVLYGVFSSCNAAIYTNLRATKEGITTDVIAEVFA